MCDGTLEGLVHGAKPGGLNMLNTSKRFQDMCELMSPDGFFQKVNAPWVDASVARKDRILVGSDIGKHLTDGRGNLTGFGREIERYEKVHRLRYDPVSQEMVYPDHPSYSKLESVFSKEEK